MRYYSNLFKICDTHGLPIECAYDVITNEGFIVDWYQFCLDARMAGWKLKTCKTKIEHCLRGDFKSEKYITSVLSRVGRVYEKHGGVLNG